MKMQIVSKCEKARIPGQVIEEIARDAAWNPAAKKGLEVASAQLASKYLNASGISAEYQPEVVVGLSLAVIGVNHMKILNRLDALIRAQNPTPEKTPAPAPAPSQTESKKGP